MPLSSPENAAADGEQHQPGEDAQKGRADPGPQQDSHPQRHHAAPMQLSFSTHAKNTPRTVYAGGVSACQKSLAEFGGVSRQIKSNHFLSGRVPDRKYISGCKSSAAALCRAQPPQAALSASQCELFAIGEQGVRAADCKKLVGKARKGFFDSLKHPPHSLCRGYMLYG